MRRLALEDELEQKYKNNVVAYSGAPDVVVYGKIDRLAVEVKRGTDEYIVIFQIRQIQYQESYKQFLQTVKVISNG